MQSAHSSGKLPSRARSFELNGDHRGSVLLDAVIFRGHLPLGDGPVPLGILRPEGDPVEEIEDDGFPSMRVPGRLELPEGAILQLRLYPRLFGSADGSPEARLPGKEVSSAFTRASSVPLTGCAGSSLPQKEARRRTEARASGCNHASHPGMPQLQGLTLNCTASWISLRNLLFERRDLMPSAEMHCGLLKKHTVVPEVPAASRPLSHITEKWREENGDYRRPDSVNRQVGGLPALQGGEGAAAPQEPRVQPGRPPQVDEQDEVLPEGGHLVGAEPELGDARRDRRQGRGVGGEGGGQEQS